MATVSNLNFNDSFMLVNTSNNINDYTAVIHEFGHYYADMMDDGTNSTSDYSSLDLSEMHSQGLELLMMNQNFARFKKTIFW